MSVHIVMAIQPIVAWKYQFGPNKWDAIIPGRVQKVTPHLPNSMRKMNLVRVSQQQWFGIT